MWTFYNISIVYLPLSSVSYKYISKCVFNIENMVIVSCYVLLVVIMCGTPLCTFSHIDFTIHFHTLH